MTGSEQNFGSELCRRVSERLVDLMPGASDAVAEQAELDGLRSHIAHCPRCGPLMAEMNAIAGASAGLGEIEPPGLVSARILAAARAAVAAKPRSRQRTVRALYVAAPCLAAAAALLFWLRARNETYLPQPVPVPGEAAPRSVSDGLDGVARQNEAAPREKGFAEPPPGQAKGQEIREEKEAMQARAQPRDVNDALEGLGGRHADRSRGDSATSSRKAKREVVGSGASAGLPRDFSSGQRDEQSDKEGADEAMAGNFAVPPSSAPATGAPAPSAHVPSAARSAGPGGSGGSGALVAETAQPPPPGKDAAGRSGRADTLAKEEARARPSLAAERAPGRALPAAKAAAAPAESDAPAGPATSTARGAGAITQVGPRAEESAQQPGKTEAAKPASALEKNLGGMRDEAGWVATDDLGKKQSTISVDEQRALFRRLQTSDVTCQEIFSTVKKLEQSDFSLVEPHQMATAYEVRARCQPTDSAKAADRAAAQKLRNRKPAAAP